LERILIGDQCEILVGRGLPSPLLPPARRRRVAVLTQPGASAVAGRVAGALECPAEVVVLPDREAAKTLEVVGGVYARLAEINLARPDTIVGVGGGTVTDVAGFVAATWLRGVEWAAVPTTLLGAVDAAIGGKTGINVDVGSATAKNLVGAFWHPRRVAIDLDSLEALPAGLRREGTAEALKAGLVGDPAIVEAYRRSGPDAPLDVVVPRAVRVKAEVVGGDFREGGRRAILNFGHTLGHAIETVAGLSHGEAVAVGMAAAAAVSARRYGFPAGRLVDLLFSLGLPVAAAGASRRAVLDLVARDKKGTGDEVRMVLLRAVADPVVEAVSSEEIDAALAAVGIH
jgi:3-dehydroquinate synthase